MPNNGVPDGWEVVTDTSLPAGWEVATDEAPLPPKEGRSSGGASASLAGVRAVPGIIHKGARFAANHPAATQKMIGAGSSVATSALGAGIGSVFGPVGTMTGAVAGAGIRGMTPTQATIREMAGRLAGEAPEVAANAARALGIQNYAKETIGVKIKPADIIPRRGGSPALDAYAKSQGRDIVKLVDEFGNVVAGPEAVSQQVARKAPGIVSRTARTVGKVLAPLSAATGITDFMQTVEPTRRDIGVMGVGKPVADPTPDQLTVINARNKAALAARLAARPSPIDAILRAIGLR